MCKKLLASLRAVLVLMGFLLSFLTIPSLVIVLALIRYLLPLPAWRQGLTHTLQASIVPWWWALNNFFSKLIPIQWQISGDLEQISNKKWYFIIANHQSWLDILVIGKVFNYRAPALKFFMKWELLWSLPLAGVASWFMGFPFMRRYSKDYLKKHPEKKGKDIETTRLACQQFRTAPTSIINFLEGTRFSEEKNQRQQPSYRHLLKPKAMGFAFVLNELHDKIDQIIDVTIVYSRKQFSIWDFFCGRVKQVHVDFQLLDVPKDLFNGSTQDKAFRRSFQAWVNQRWQVKDAIMQQMLQPPAMAAKADAKD